MNIQSKVFVRHLRIHARHGVMQQERKVGGDFDVSICVWLPVLNAAIDDDVNLTVDYAMLHQIVKEEMDVPAALLENVAWRIARRTLDTFHTVETVEVEVVKVNPPMGGQCEGAGVSVRAER